MAAEEGYINHYNYIRLRVKGSGSFNMQLRSLDNVKTATIPPLTLQANTNIEVAKKCNFQQQRAQLFFYVDEMDATFQLNKIIFFLKPVAENYPG